MAVPAGRVGYKYYYDFSIDESIFPLYEEIPTKKAILFETRTNFILKAIDKGTEDKILDSERVGAFVAPHSVYPEAELRISLEYRLIEYWMTKDEILALVRAALDFAQTNAAAHAVRGVIPVLITLRVSTVQQLGETIEVASERALRARDLLPAYLWSALSAATFPGPSKLRKWNRSLREFLMGLPRVRVTDVDQGLGMMRACGVCRRPPTVGAQITVIQCSHSFHSHCIIKHLMKDCLCPDCEAPTYDPAMARRLPDPPPIPQHFFLPPQEAI